MREKGLPDNIAPVTETVGEREVADRGLNAVFSTMTYHEFVTPDSLAGVRRAFAPGGRFVAVGWITRGDGESNPPTDERFGLATARRQLFKVGYTVVRLGERPETFCLAGRPRNKQGVLPAETETIPAMST